MLVRFTVAISGLKALPQRVYVARAIAFSVSMERHRPRYALRLHRLSVAMPRR